MVHGEAIDRDAGYGVIPLRNRALFPGARASIDLIRPGSVALVDGAAVGGAPRLVLVTQPDATSEEEPAPESLPRIGVLARLVDRLGDDERGRLATLEGVARVRLRTIEKSGGSLVARIEATPDAIADRAAVAALDATLRPRALALLSALPAEELRAIERESDPGVAADRIAARIDAPPRELAELVGTLDVAERLRRLQEIVAREESRQAGMRATAARIAHEPVDLWVMGPERNARIDRLRSTGAITPEEAAQLDSYGRDGFVVWERLIPAADVDAFVADLERLHESPGRFLTTDHRRSRPFRYNARAPDRFESVFDSYVNLESSRRVCFHPTIVRFLELLFGTRPIATQQLLFRRSNGHEAHQDTAFVCMEEPLLMAASWIALEDVVAGRGELTYYVGSHRLSGRRFADGSRRFTPGSDDGLAMRDDLVARCRDQGCTKRDFLARKGDVFLWSADLVHASNPRTRPIEETRLSCVTHYCPETTRPLWMTVNPDRRALAPCGARALLASSHYRLPESGALPARFMVPEFGQPLPS